VNRVKFLPRCPKCESTSIKMCRDAAWCVRGWPHDASLSCRICGHRAYGQAAVDHTDLEWGRHEAEERERLLQEERERLASPTPDTCAWKGCALPRRKKSIYCSRVCSNKNAHARHTARKQDLGRGSDPSLNG